MDLEQRDHLAQLAGLIAQGAGGGSRLFHQGGVLLRHLVKIAHGLVHLADALLLLARGSRNLGDQVADTLHAHHDVLHGRARFGHLLRAGLDTLD